MKQILIDLYRQQRELHRAMVELTDAQMGEAAKGDLIELADCAYAMREIASFADEIRKRANKIGEHAQKVGCFIATQTSLISGNPADLKIKTEYCTATADVKQIVSTPDKRKEPEAYRKVLQHYGFIEEALFDATDDKNPLVVAYWPGVIERINADIAAGKPTPPGIDPSKMTAEYRLSIRANRGILE